MNYDNEKIKLIQNIIKKNKNIYMKNNSNINNMTFENFCNAKSCQKCNGCCCKDFPCGYSPKEFININDLDYMKSILDLGILCIDEQKLSYKSPVLSIRVRGEKDNKENIIGTKSINNKCILLGDNGCKLKANERPIEGLLLLPPSDNCYGLDLCYSLYDREVRKKEWQKYQEALIKLKEYYKDKYIPINTVSDEKILKLQNSIRGK